MTISYLLSNKYKFHRGLWENKQFSAFYSKERRVFWCYFFYNQGKTPPNLKALNKTIFFEQDLLFLGQKNQVAFITH